MKEPSPAKIKGPKTLRRLLFVFAFLLVLFFSAWLFLKSQIETKVLALGEAYGLHIQYAESSLSLFSGIALEQVAVRDLLSPDFTLDLERLETDLSLWKAILGERRPKKLFLRAGDIQLKAIPGRLTEKKGPNVPNGQKSASRALEIKGEGLRVHIADNLEVLQGLRLEESLMERLQFEVLRDEKGAIQAKLQADLQNAEGSGKLQALYENGRFSMGLDGDFMLGMQLGKRAIRLSFSKLLLHEGLALLKPRVHFGNERFWAKDLHAHLPKKPSFSLLLEALEHEGLDFQLSKGELSSQHRKGKARFEDIGASLKKNGPSLALGLEFLGLDLEEDAPKLSLQVPLTRLQWANLPLSPKLDNLLSGLTSFHMKEPHLELHLSKTDGTFRKALPSEPLDHEDDLPPMPSDEGSEKKGKKRKSDKPPLKSPAWLESLLGLTPAPLGLDSLINKEEVALLTKRFAQIHPQFENASMSLYLEEEGPKAFLKLQDVFLTLKPEKDSLHLRFRSELSGQGEEKQDQVQVDAFFHEEGRLQYLEGKLSGAQVASQFAKLYAHLDVQKDSRVALDFHYEPPSEEEAAHRIEGAFSLQNFSFHFWRISDEEIKNLRMKGRFKALLDRKAHRLELGISRFELADAHFQAHLELQQEKKAPAAFKVSLEMPRQSCRHAADAIPRELLLNLSSLRLRGEMDFQASLDLDLANPRELKLRVDGNLDDCEVLSLGPNIKPEALKKDFIHHPVEPELGLREDIAVGRGSKEWVPKEEIAPIALAAAWITEDRKYDEHKGVRWDLIQTALKMDLDHQRFIYGGSTITQQLVKNLYLTRTKNLARKLEEMIIAWEMERVLTKDEILELYVNCIEYGPDLYGIKAASKLYFGKAPSELNALDSAFLMGLKPYPLAGYRQFESGTLNKWWVSRVSYVLKLMAKYAKELISMEEVEALAPYIPQFLPPPSKK